MLTTSYILPDLPPPDVDLQTPRVLTALNKASRALAELKGRSLTIPNQQILIDTLSLQEALASSRIENIVTTHDELFQLDLISDRTAGSPATKEVQRYRDALMLGHKNIKEKEGLLPVNLLIRMYQCLKQHDDGFRKTPGTVLRNESTGEHIYIPPQFFDEIMDHMSALERFINEDESCSLDPLIKMALIHHQFESIHPFADGNGRIGRMLNVLYLTRSGLLDSPILYLSRGINQTKQQYYELLQSVRDQGRWEDWVVYMLDTVSTTSHISLRLVADMRELMAEFKKIMRSECPKIYSQDLLNNLFRHPYTRTEYVARDLGVSRQTARKYMKILGQADLVREHKHGRNNYYINQKLVGLFMSVSDGDI